MIQAYVERYLAEVMPVVVICWLKYRKNLVVVRRQFSVRLNKMNVLICKYER